MDPQKPPSKGSQQDGKLAQALRANLRRRKAAERQHSPRPQTPEDDPPA